MNILSTILALALGQIAPSSSSPLTLLQAGQSSYRIVLEPEASPSEELAARDLQSHFKACTGVELPLSKGKPESEGPMIVLGCGPMAESLGVAPDPESLGEQGFLIRTVPPHLVIAGTKVAGTLYGVHRFLEDHLGVRWYAPGVTRTPSLTDLSVSSLDQLVKPAFLMRNTSYEWPGRDDDFICRMGDNGGSGGADRPQGIQHAHDGRCHSFFRFVSPSEFFATHPEYFSEIGGVRVGEETQLCLSNPEVLDLVTQRMLERMAKDPVSRQHNFSQLDYYNYCQCPKCSEINAKYGSLGGVQFWFVNQLAERTSKVYPNKLIGTLAYMYTEEPPKDMKMHPNVAVWLCHMFPSCDSHPIATCEKNASYKRRAQRWSEICDHVYIWHYIVDFAHYYNPFPNLRAMAADMKFYRDIGVEGIYLQGMGHGGGGGEFSLLRPYFGMKLLWDPDQDRDALIQDFLQGYYGPAWEPIWAYVNLLHDKVEKENIHMHLYTNPGQGYLTDDIMSQSKALFDQAEAAVQNDAELLERVKVARMPLTYASLFPRNGYRIEGGELDWQGEIAPVGEILEFINRMKTHGFQTVREQVGEPDKLLLLSGIFRSNLEVVTLQNEAISVDLVPTLAGRALRIIDKKTGDGVTSHNNVPVLFFPFCGGLEDRVGETFQFFGWVEPCQVAEKTETSATLASRTFDGFELKKIYSLEPGRSVLKVTSTVTNPGDKPREARLRSHLELNFGPLDQTRVRFVDRSGTSVDKDLQGIIAGLREGEHYYDESCPDGSWILSGTKKVELEQRWDPSTVSFTWLYAYPKDLGELEAELWTERKTLAPKESMSLTQTLELRPVK